MRMTKKQKRMQRQEGVLDNDGSLLLSKIPLRTDIKPIRPKQQCAFDAWKRGSNLFLHGLPGTGKTFLAIYFALMDVYDTSTSYEKLYIIRSTVSTRNQGFMPGTRGQKESIFEDAYPQIFDDLFERPNIYNILKQQNIIEFKSTSYLRGTTFNNCIVIVDEMQNMNDRELDTIITRIGCNAKIFFAGDLKQDDLTNERYREESGLASFMKIIFEMKSFEFIEFYADDIVRSEFVKEYILTKDRLGLQCQQ